MTISILIATYNNPTALQHCLKSVFAQKVLPDEILVAEDFPDCCSQKVIEELIDVQQNIIRYQKHKKNLGRTKNYRWLLENSTSDFVMFLDGDDEIVNPDFIADAKHALKETGCDMFSGGCRKNYGNSCLDQQLTSADKVMNGEDYFKLWYSAKQTLPHSATIFRRSLSLSTGGYTIDVLNTDIVSLRILLLSCRLYLSSKVYSQWNYHQTNASCNVDIHEMAENLKTVSLPYKRSKDIYGRRLGFMCWYVRAYLKYVLSMLHMLYPDLKSMMKFVRLI